MKKIIFTLALAGMTAFMAVPAIAGNGGCKGKDCTCSGSCKDNKCTMACCSGKDDKACKKGDKNCTKDCKKDNKTTTATPAAK